MSVLRNFFGGPRRARGMSNMAAITVSIVVLVLAWSLIRRLIGFAFVLLHWAIEVAVLVAVILLVALAIKYLARKME
jgi:hypothetical protein